MWAPGNVEDGALVAGDKGDIGVEAAGLGREKGILQPFYLVKYFRTDFIVNKECFMDWERLETGYLPLPETGRGRRRRRPTPR